MDDIDFYEIDFDYIGLAQSNENEHLATTFDIDFAGGIARANTILSVFDEFGKLVLISDKAGANVFLSGDAADSWQGPFATGAERAELSLVGDEFWLVSSKSARASSDGKTWQDLPAGIPTGKIVASPDGTLVNVNRRRASVLRSADGGKTWDEVFAFEEPKSEHVHGAQGLRDLAFGYVTEKPIK